MEQLTMMMQAFIHLLIHPSIIFFCVLGTILGVLLGAIPGLTGLVGIALLLPITYYMDPMAGIIMVYAINKGATYGGSIPAILLNTPGTAAAACTIMDGYPLTLQGKQGKALKVAVISSAVADILSDLVLIFLTVYLARLVFAFGPIQMTAVLFFAFVTVGTVTGKSPIKGLMSALIGLLLSTIGLDIITGFPRFHFGMTYLRGGLGLVPILIGMFVGSEVLVQASKIHQNSGKRTLAPVSDRPEDSEVSWAEFKSILPDILRSFGIGQVLGMLPGIGAAITPWVGYGQAKAASRHPEEFGKGSIKGVAAAEAANNAVSGANLMPLLTLGIPVSTDVVLIMGVFMLHGMRLGPRIFVEQGALVYGIFAGGLLSIVTYFLIGYFLAKPTGLLVSMIPVRYIFPFVLVLTFIGTFAVSSILLDTFVMVVFGVVGYLMRKFEFSLPALAIAFMLGGRFEENIRRSLILTRGRVTAFISDPISLVFIALGLIVIVMTMTQGSGFFNRSKTNTATADLDDSE